MASRQAILSSFIESAPPGELQNVIADVQALANKDAIGSLESSFQKYHEVQYSTFKLPKSTTPVIVSEYNALGNNRYFDTASQTSFEVQHSTQEASNIEPYSLNTQHLDLIRSLQQALTSSAAEHFASHAYGVFPTKDDSNVVIVLVANKYSPQNFWNGRWRSTYTVQPSGSVTGDVKVDVHYYEDGNVRMATKKSVELSGTGGSAESIVREIAKAENKFQEELNRAFVTLAEGSFKSLRRQLPVTRQKVEWEKIGGYRLGQDIGGGRSK
ncbi:hypothetical protein AMS68_007080 [Peltaster fructicola]|uniref:F-actin-capping protein subunit alpha n=1 Tax=Peltaster fructicola TaxID=286661 RepID=A0A6H0Y3J0_9PEZI|nr:hypothetical protein AMS68_007080 [Peltaster fructicola]